MPTPEDTIVAIATPPGSGAVGVVRISGGDTERIATAMLGRLPEPRVARLQRFANAAGETLDYGLALYFPGPASLTGESVLELQGHGSPLVMAMLVDAAVELGARRAAPGEFSRRAFLNDKLDLAQAEAIADLIGCGTAQAARAALRSLSGAFSAAVNELAEQLAELRTYVEAAIDFPEEEIDLLGDAALEERLQRCRQSFSSLLDRAAVGRILRDGYRVVLVGRPNAGKSSLMNRLSGEDTAIVTEVAGTTRDVLRERVVVDGLAIELVDTAGLRDDPDRVEEEGIRRARQAIANADAVLWIQDATGPAVAALEETIPTGAAVTIVRNKIDLSGEPPGLQGNDEPVIRLSAKTGAGIDALRRHIRDLAGFRDLGEGAFTARSRHLEALRDARAHFEAGCEALRQTQAAELLAEELRLSQQALGTITGAVSSDELLGRIFAEFCIGK